MKAETDVVIGVDAHKRTHTLVAPDELGREVAAKTLAATADGHLAAIAWAGRWPSRRKARKCGPFVCSGPVAPPSPETPTFDLDAGPVCAR
jgi:hypothetical protein